jgi:hypothetical protein
MAHAITLSATRSGQDGHVRRLADPEAEQGRDHRPADRSAQATVGGPAEVPGERLASVIV